jgi:hypothetical protein
MQMNSQHSKKGQVVNLAIIAVALGTAACTKFIDWGVDKFLNGPDNAAAATSALDQKVNLLCNDYTNTVSRMDQNIQNIGKAVKAPVVVGSTNTNPCLAKK